MKTRPTTGLQAAMLLHNYSRKPGEVSEPTLLGRRFPHPLQSVIL